MRSYKLAAFAVASMAVAAIGLLAAPAREARAQGRYTPPPPCDCTHLSTLQAELRNAILLEQRMRAQADRLRNMSRDDAHSAYVEFSRTSGQGLEPVPGAEKMSRISYQPFGDTLPFESATSGRHTDAQLCARSGNAQNDLDQGLSYTACRDIADVVRAHEDFHVETCVRMGYRAHLFVHKSEIATDEAEAYGRQAARLRAIIMRILQEADPRVEFEESMTGGDIYSTRGEARFNFVMEMAPDEFMLRGSGESTTRVQLVDSCSVTGGSPFTDALSALATTDGLTAEIDIGSSGERRWIGFQCPGQRGRGEFGHVASTPPSVRLKLENGASVPYGQSSARGGAVSGRVTLELCRQSAP